MSGPFLWGVSVLRFISAEGWHACNEAISPYTRALGWADAFIGQYCTCRQVGSGSLPTPTHCVSLSKYKRKKTQGGRGEELVVVNRRVTTYERNGKEEKVSRGRWKET